MNIDHPTKSRRTHAIPIFCALAFTALIGCSSTPEPVAEMAAAKTSLVAADNADTTKHAPVAIDRAKQKLKRAETAIAKEEYEEAKRLAEEAQADAELAHAIASKTEAEKAVKELENSIQVLREEILRARRR
jgi:ribosomal protein S6